MKYLCVHCDHRFDHEGDKKPRCPQCMRRHGLEELRDEKKAQEARRPAWVMPAAVVGAVGLLAGGYAIWDQSTPVEVTGDAPLAPLEVELLRGHLRAADADVDELYTFLDVDESVSEWASSTTSGASTPAAKVEKIVEAIRERASAQAFVTWSMDTPRDTPTKLPAQVLEALSEDGGRAKLYPIEVAAFAVAAARSVDVDAMLADAWEFANDRSPPDPSGRHGYFLVALYEGAPGEGDARYFDPYGGRTNAPSEDGVRVLTDPQAAAGVANTLALHALVHESDHARALDHVQRALRLDRRSPYIRSTRAAVLIASGGTQEGLQEFEAAAQLRPDSPRRNNVAGVYLAMQDVERASREVAAALEAHPDFAGAHATMAALHLASGETEQARSELETAERLDPDQMMIQMLWADYHMRSGAPMQAAERAREAVRRRGFDWQTRVHAGAVFRAANLFDEMREQARAALDLVPDDQRAAVRELILSRLGSTALEEPLDDEDWMDDEDLGGGDDALPTADFQLGEDSALLGDGDVSLGGGAPSLGGGSLLGDDEAPAPGGGPTLMLGDPSNIRLRDPGSSLRLDLGGE